MDKVNIYMIKTNKKNKLIEKLIDKGYQPNQNTIKRHLTSSYFENIDLNFSMQIYIKNGKPRTPLKWNWILKEFNESPRRYTAKPSAVLLINETRTNRENTENTLKNTYAVSFGHAYSILKHFCDKNWSLDFAKHMSIEKVTSMTLLSPNSVINRKINNYVNFNSIEITSGDAVNQINADLKSGKSPKDLNEKISLSQSLIFKIDNANLNSLIRLIDYVNFINQTDIKNRIPYYKEVTSKEMKDTLNKSLIENIFRDIESETGDYCINICDFKQMGDKIKFINEYDEFELRYGEISDKNQELNVRRIYEFIKTNLNKNDNILEIKLNFKDDETSEEYELKMKEIIMYTCEQESYTFDEGTWFEFNDIYLENLKKSIEEIDIEYETEYDFDEDEYINFLRRKDPNYDLKTDKDKKSFKRIWYKERAFNILRKDDGFICNDRTLDTIDGHDLEIADLFKLDEKSMYAVKIGSGSANLCYVIDQSLVPMRMLDNGEIKNVKNEEIKVLNKNDIKNVYIWLILTRQELPLKDGKPNLNEMDALILKNKIDYWKKEVLMSGRTPKIKINYISF